MSKRYIFPQQYGERKKPKLSVTISDHNFPLSQTPGTSKESNQADNWGDDNDDEILLLASQACEDAYISSNDISTLPDYSLCMQAASSSTQIPNNHQPSTSVPCFSFKQPVSGPANVISTNLKEKCHRISSPLPGITPKVMQNLNRQENLTDDLIFNDKIFKGHDSEQVYRQMLQLQEENTKLKSENGKLLEKCVTKEGEASILRTQLKTCQVAVDNARLEKLKAQERVQTEWTDKLAAANKQMQDLRTQLDFKNLEIISIKEKCKMLESSKVKLTQVTVAGNDISFSNRNGSSNPMMLEPLSQRLNQHQNRRVKVSVCAVQTENNAHFLKLHKAHRTVPSNLKEILPHILQAGTEQQHSILEYSETLHKPTEFTQNKCRIFSKFHRIPSNPNTKTKSKTKLSVTSLYEDLTYLATALDKGIENGIEERYINVWTHVHASLVHVRAQLEEVRARCTSTFQRDMDERHVASTSSLLAVCSRDLLSHKSLYKEEQAIVCRRMVAILSHVVESTNDVLVNKLLQFEAPTSSCNGSSHGNIIEVISRICHLLDITSCAVMYSGLLLSITILLEKLWERTDRQTIHSKLLDIVKTIITARPLAAVSIQMLSLLRKLASFGPISSGLCAGNAAGNLKVDYDQGVLLYRKDSCALQVYTRQIECALKCTERLRAIEEAAWTSARLIAFYCNVNIDMASLDKNRCECGLVMNQVIIYALQICVLMLDNLQPGNEQLRSLLESICRCGIQLVWGWVSREVETASRLAHAEGHYYVFVETCHRISPTLLLDQVIENQLTELLGTLQPSSEDIELPSPLHRQVWADSFARLSVAD